MTTPNEYLRNLPIIRAYSKLIEPKMADLDFADEMNHAMGGEFAPSMCDEYEDAETNTAITVLLAFKSEIPTVDRFLAMVEDYNQFQNRQEFDGYANSSTYGHAANI